MPKQPDTAQRTPGAAAESRSASQESRAQAPWSLNAFNGPALEPVAGAGRASAAAIAQLHSRVFRDALRFNAELLDFASRRVRADIEASNRLSRCESVTEAMDVMSDFYQSALTDYAEGSAALVRLSAITSPETTEEAIAEAARLNERKTD